MYKKIAGIISLLLCCTAASAEAWQWQMGFGKGLNKVLIQQHGIANAEAASVGVHLPVDWVAAFEWGGVDKTYIKLQYSHLWGDYHDQTPQLSISETALEFRWLADDYPLWFAEIGVGLSHLSDRRYESIEMHGPNNFSLDFALGKRLDVAPNWELSLRYRHYSNGYTHRPNPGLDYGAVVLAYLF